MKYTKSQCKSIVRALQEAKLRLCRMGDDEIALIRMGKDTNKFVHICNALGQDKGSVLAKRIISERIAPHATVIDWLHEVHGINTYRLEYERQQYRHRWVDELIREFSK